MVCMTYSIGNVKLAMVVCIDSLLLKMRFSLRLRWHTVGYARCIKAEMSASFNPRKYKQQ